jgi:hypothetical protein
MAIKKHFAYASLFLPLAWDKKGGFFFQNNALLHQSVLLFPILFLES